MRFENHILPEMGVSAKRGGAVTRYTVERATAGMESRASGSARTVAIGIGLLTGTCAPIPSLEPKMTEIFDPWLKGCSVGDSPVAGIEPIASISGLPPQPPSLSSVGL